MTSLMWLIPIALGMGLVALIAFLWSLQSGQYEDLDGAAERVLLNSMDRPAETNRRHAARTKVMRSGSDVERQKR